MTLYRATLLAALTLTSILSHCAITFSQIQTNWTPAGVNTNFHNAENWDNGIPGDEDEAIFGIGGPFNVTMDSNANIKTFSHVAGTMTLAGGNELTIGSTPNLNGFLIVVNPGTQFDSQTDLNVGAVELGSLTILNGADVDSAGNLFVGQNAGIQGIVTVNGNGSTLTSNDLRIGQFGLGELTVQNSGIVSNVFARVGHHPSSIGVATVTGNGSQWNNSDFIAVGAIGGTGTLNIENGGRVFAGESVLVATDSTANGTINITGSGSVLESADFLRVGNDGTGILNVMASGEVEAARCRIGRRDTADGTVNLTGSSSFSLTEFLVIGREGEGTLNVSANSDVSCDAAILGEVQFGTGMVTIADTGSSLTCNTLQIGAEGIGDMFIENGGSVTVATTASINEFSQLIFQDMSLDDAGALSSGGMITVNGNIIFLSGDGEIDGDIELVNNGDLQVGSQATGNIHGNVTNNGQRILIGPAGVLNFFGDLTGDAPFIGTGPVNFFGGVKPGNSPGAVTFEGDAILHATSNLEIEIGGTNPGGQYDQLLVDGDVSLDGNLTIVPINAFQPSPDQEFTIIDVGGNLAGAFDGFFQGDVVETIGNIQLEIDYFGGDGNDVTLIAVAGDVLLGDVNMDGSVDLLDVGPFVNLITTGMFQAEADINQDMMVNLLDVGPFVALLSGS